jgi:hypothetical protein
LNFIPPISDWGLAITGASCEFSKSGQEFFFENYLTYALSDAGSSKVRLFRASFFYLAPVLKSVVCPRSQRDFILRLAQRQLANGEIGRFGGFIVSSPDNIVAINSAR